MVSTGEVSLDPMADNSLFDEDGSALVIHEDPDDLMTDPSGESGARIACGIIAPPMNGTPVASPVASGEEGESGATPDEPMEALDSLVFAPSTITVSPGDAIEAINVGALEHDFVVDELGIGVDLPNGEIVEIQIPEDAEPGEYRFYCSVPGHEAAGMVGTLIIE